MARILFIEDDSPSRMRIQSMLSERGHDVVAAENADAALQALGADGPFDLVLAEMDLPGVNGIEFALELEREYPDTPVLLMTARKPGTSS